MNRILLSLRPLVVIFIASAYAFRYELGIKKPNFKEGDCISWTTSNEFKPNTYVNLVLKVGKKEYLLAPIENESVILVLDNTERIKMADEFYTKIECTYTKVIK